EIARTFLGFKGDRISVADCDWLCDAAERVMSQPDWEEQVLRQSNVEKVFLTNEFDDPLEGFDTSRYVPCLRTDDLVFRLQEDEVRGRLARVTGIEVNEAGDLRGATRLLFERFVTQGAKACAISLPPDFVADTSSEKQLTNFMKVLWGGKAGTCSELTAKALLTGATFWMLAEHCREFKLPFDLMIGVNRQVYRYGVHQGQDLFDQRTSLIQY